MLCFGIAKMAMAQKDSLAFDEQGKYIYYRVLVANTNEAETLNLRVAAFFKSASLLKLLGFNEAKQTFDGEGYFVVSKPSSLGKHDDGKITYKLRIEIKGEKYRYWLSNFVFTPYYKDRYNNMVPQPGVEIPIENISKKIETRDAAHYLDECAAFGKKLGTKLKQYMDAQPVAKKDDGKKVIDTKKW